MDVSNAMETQVPDDNPIRASKANITQIKRKPYPDLSMDISKAKSKSKNKTQTRDFTIELSAFEKNLAPELRDHIYGYCLVWNGKSPALLAAFRGHALYRDLLAIFKKINKTFEITEKNLGGVKYMTEASMSGIQNLELESHMIMAGDIKLNKLFAEQPAFKRIPGFHIRSDYIIPMLECSFLMWTTSLKHGESPFKFSAILRTDGFFEGGDMSTRFWPKMPTLPNEIEKVSWVLSSPTPVPTLSTRADPRRPTKTHSMSTWTWAGPAGGRLTIKEKNWTK